jgi:hypothetical protein
MSSTLMENIQKIIGTLETGRKASLLYLLIMCVYCVYSAMSKYPNHLPNSLKRIETSVVLTDFCSLLYFIFSYTVTISYRRSGTRKVLSGT